MLLLILYFSEYLNYWYYQDKEIRIKIGTFS